MPCYHPLTAYQCSDGEIIWSEKKGYDITRQLSLPCGQCIGCRLERSRQWAIRCMHEASLYKNNCFITLTYSDDHLPSDMSLHYDDFQKFMKRLRKRFKGLEPSANVNSNEKYPIRFYMAGEYGENFGRPHFHACIFNFDFPDKKLWQRTSSGSRIYRSSELERLWSFGYSSIGEVNFQSAAYVARYIMKKVTGRMEKAEGKPQWSCGLEHYQYCDLETGEIKQLQPEFNKMSLKPGIGADWYNKYKNDVYPHDYVVVNGKKVKPPKFYDKLYKNDYPYEFDMLHFKRVSDATARYEDNTPERLAVKEKVTEARLSRLVRTLT